MPLMTEEERMNRSKCSKQQIAFISHQAEKGTISANVRLSS